MKQKMSFIEFYNTYWKDNSNGISEHYLAKLDEATKQNKKLVINRGRGFDWDGYKFNLMQTARVLIENKSIVLASKNPQKYIDDLYNFLEIGTRVEPIKDGNDLYEIILESVRGENYP